MGKGTNSAAGLMEEIKMDKQNPPANTPDEEPQQGTAEEGLTDYDRTAMEAQKREEETGVDQQDGDAGETEGEGEGPQAPDKAGGSA